MWLRCRGDRLPPRAPPPRARGPGRAGCAAPPFARARPGSCCRARRAYRPGRAATRAGAPKGIAACASSIAARRPDAPGAHGGQPVRGPACGVCYWRVAGALRRRRYRLRPAGRAPLGRQRRCAPSARFRATARRAVRAVRRGRERCAAAAAQHRARLARLRRCRSGQAPARWRANPARPRQAIRR